MEPSPTGIHGTVMVFPPKNGGRPLKETWLSADNFMDRSLEYRRGGILPTDSGSRM